MCSVQRSTPPAGRYEMPRVLPARTDFAGLRGRRVLAVVDDDNLTISLAECVRRLRYGTLLSAIRRVADTVTGCVVLTCAAGDGRPRRHLEGLGWRVVAVPREVVRTHRGAEVKANADMDLCFEAARLVGEGVFDVVLVGSGDGDLCVSVARGVRRAAPWCDVVSLSVRESSSTRLFTRPDLFDRNILIGYDITR